MGEEEKKAEQEEAGKKPQEERKGAEEDAKKTAEEEKKAEESKEPPPPQDIVLRLYMHCEGCAKKVRKCLRSFQGVEDVQTDCKTHKVVVKGEKADPLKVLAVLQRKCHRQVELVSPIPKPPTEEEKKSEENKENVQLEEKEEVITAVLRVHMHCDACAQKIQKCIQRMKGVQSANADMKSSQVTVMGGFDPAKLVEYVYKKTAKHAVIVKIEPEKNEEKSKEEKEEKKGEKEGKEKGGGGGGEAEGEKKEAEEAKQGAGEETTVVEGEEETKVVASPYFVGEPRMYDLYYHRPVQFHMDHVYPPQIFSDENPNACSVM